MEVNIITALESYGTELDSTIFKNDGTNTLPGIDFGDLETGLSSETKFLYFRHDGLEPIYAGGFFLRALGTNWGGYVASSPDSVFPYNPNFFRSGGVDENNIPNASTRDYEFLRTSAANDPENGVRLHLDRNNEFIRTPGLGYNNQGLSVSPISLQPTALDFTQNPSLAQTVGVIYPEPVDQSKYAKVGDEAKIGFSLRFSEDVVGSGHVQLSVAFKYRYTA